MTTDKRFYMKATVRNLRALSKASDDSTVKHVIGKVCGPFLFRPVTVEDRVEELKVWREHPELRLPAYRLGQGYDPRLGQLSRAADLILQRVTNRNGVAWTSDPYEYGDPDVVILDVRVSARNEEIRSRIEKAIISEI